MNIFVLDAVGFIILHLIQKLLTGLKQKKILNPIKIIFQFKINEKT